MVANRADLHIKNFRFALPLQDSWTIEQVYDGFYPPIKHPNSRLDGLPIGAEIPPYSVSPGYFWTPGEEGINKQLKIIDFGEASFIDEKRLEIHTPMNLRSPESFFGENLGLPADMWVIACTIFEIFGKYPMFEGYLADQNSILSEMVDTFGKLPSRWWTKWEYRDRYFSDDMLPTRLTRKMFPRGPKWLRDRVAQIRLVKGKKSEESLENLKTSDSAGLEKLLASFLEYEPSERATAEESLKSEWVGQLLQELEMR